MVVSDSTSGQLIVPSVAHGTGYWSTTTMTPEKLQPSPGRIARQRKYQLNNEFH